MTEKIKHHLYDVIVAWASGEKIQFRVASSYSKENGFYFNSEFKDYTSAYTPDFSDGKFEWRIKPKTITKKYRMALFSDGEVVACDVTTSCLDDPIEYKLRGFIRWVGDVVEVEIDV